MAQEKRKNIRVEHRGRVHFVTENRSFQGSSVNISRTGMQVVVNVPQSHESIRSISFRLPASGRDVHVPCRLVRTERGEAPAEQTFGIEFLHEAETELLLIEKYVQDSAAREADARQLPRTSCHISGVTADAEGVRVLSVDNLSTDGLLFSYTGTLLPGDVLTLVVTPLDDPRPLRLRGSVVYVVENAFRDTWSAGMRIEGLKEIDERRLCNLILALSSGSTVRGMHDHLDGSVADTGFRIGDAASIIRLLSGLSARHVPLSMLLEDSPTIRECCLVDVRGGDGSLVVQVLEGQPRVADGVGHPAYIGFPLDGASHYFRTRVAQVEADRIALDLPASVFRSDKRSYGRKHLQAGSRVVLTVGRPGSAEREVEGVIIDISRRGFLCEVDSALDTVFREGDLVRYSVDADLGLDSHGQIRHAKLVARPSGAALRVGIEAGIARGSVPVRTIDARTWARHKPFRGGEAEPPPDSIESILVSYRTREGKGIRALLNGTTLPSRAPVVVIPPSYGKRKESYAPLVATLLANFRRLGKPLVTIRYDGINRPGESHNEVTNPRRGYEMLSYRFSQGLEDLQATLDHVSANAHFDPERVILLTFSMSSLDARRLLATTPHSVVDLWISCMGVPCTQTTLRNILGGIDIIGNQRLGIPNGIMGLLGHLVDMDVLAQDALDSRYGYITDARADMARIDVPVLWINGLHDKWVDAREVEDLMSVRAPGRREMLSIPCGHNLHTSDDAIHTYKIIAAELYRHLHGEDIRPCDPCKTQMLRLVSSERERLEDRAPASMQEYWRGYLIGNERNPVGYDFYANLEEFRVFLDQEVALLELGERETIADLGCGTGLFLEALLTSLARRPQSRLDCSICALDLVPEALERTRAKCERILGTSANLDLVRLSCHQADLEPSRLIPLSRFLQASDSDWSCLRGKIQGLSGDTLDRMLERRSPDLDALMRGARPTPALLAGIHPFGQGDRKVILELNRAIRFLLGRIGKDDLRAPAPREPGAALRASDVVFDVLRFGDAAASEPTEIPGGPFTRIVASLFISYLRNPEYLLEECHRRLEPGGRLLVSSMRPDSDISTVFTNYIDAVRSGEAGGALLDGSTGGVAGALAMLNEAAGLFELEEDGYFRFYSGEELAALLQAAGFVRPEVTHAFGSPPQAVIVVAHKPIG